MKTVWVVVEGDRGYGETVLAVYFSKDAAMSHASENGHYYVTEADLHEE